MGLAENTGKYKFFGGRFPISARNTDHTRSELAAMIVGKLLHCAARQLSTKYIIVYHLLRNIFGFINNGKCASGV